MDTVLQDLWQESVITAAGFVLGLLAQRVHARFVQRRIERRYPVAGKYCSTFEDIVNGETVPEKALVHLSQEGTRIFGSTHLLDKSRREWIIEGEIIDGRYLSGIYYHESPQDPGRGTFFLEPMPGKTHSYGGIWAGYDAINREVTSGRYRWWRLADDFDIRALDSNSAEIEHAHAILGDALGDRYITSDDLVAYTKNGQDACARVAVENSEIIGVQLSRLLTDDEERHYQELLGREGITINLVAHVTAILQSIAMKSSRRGRGIGSALVADAIEQVRARGATAMVAEAWLKPDDSSLGMLQAAGFEDLARYPEYWYEDSLREGYSCPTCGNPCRCSAALMLLRL